MPKIVKLIGFLLLMLGSTSCIELVEEIKINSDLSGKYHLYLKHNGLEFVFNSVGQNIDLSGLENGLEKLKHQKEISNLRTSINPKKGKFSIQFDFSDAKSLTRAFYAGLGTKKRFYHKSFLKINASKITRPNLTPYLVKYAESQNLIDEFPSEVLLDYVNYRYRIITPQNIKSASPPNTSEKVKEYNQLYSSKSLLLQKQSTKSIIRLEKLSF